jgi:hypothetical protein
VGWEVFCSFVKNYSCIGSNYSWKLIYVLFWSSTQNISLPYYDYWHLFEWITCLLCQNISYNGSSWCRITCWVDILCLLGLSEVPWIVFQQMCESLCCKSYVLVQEGESFRFHSAFPNTIALPPQVREWR